LGPSTQAAFLHALARLWSLFLENVMADLIDELEDRAKEPLSAQGDEGRMQQHPLPDQIAAAQFLEGRRVARSGGHGARFARMKAAGGIG
jgi:hypothetical protein